MQTPGPVNGNVAVTMVQHIRSMKRRASAAGAELKETLKDRAILLIMKVKFLQRFHKLGIVDILRGDTGQELNILLGVIPGQRGGQGQHLQRTEMVAKMY